MRVLAYGAIGLMVVLGVGMVNAQEPAKVPDAAQQTAPQEQPAAEQPAAEQPASPLPQVSPPQLAAAEKLGSPAVITNTIGMHLVLIPAGEYMMGSPATEQGRKDDELQHRVRITKPFYLGAFEVTQKQYEDVMGAKPSRAEEPRNPVDTVSWDNAVAFCEKLSALPDENAAGRTYRLPTEAEWEYACRAGSTTCYSFGNDPAALRDHAWFTDNSGGTTHPVGEKLPNAWGLHDMHGNVSEWCADWYDSNYYKDSPADDPAGPSTGTERVTRGGSWFVDAKLCRSADHDRRTPAVRNYGLGFRVVAVLSKPAEPPKVTQ